MSGRYYHPDNAHKIGTFKSNVVFENWFEMVLKFNILTVNYLEMLHLSFQSFYFFISFCGIENENFWIRSIKHIDNCRQRLILLIVPQDFLFEDNCNSSKNPSSVIHVPFPKRCFSKF